MQLLHSIFGISVDGHRLPDEVPAPVEAAAQQPEPQVLPAMRNISGISCHEEGILQAGLEETTALSITRRMGQESSPDMPHDHTVPKTLLPYGT